MDNVAGFSEDVQLTDYARGVLADVERADRLAAITDRGQLAGRSVVTVTGQGALLKLKVNDARGRRGGGGRGVVRGMSAASRKRLLEFLSRMDQAEVERAAPLFVTLTYPAEYPSDRVAKRDHLRVFLQALTRHWGGCGVWRLEHQGRGAPHFHIILYYVPLAAVPWIRAKWASVIEYTGAAQLQIDTQVIHGWRKCLAYVGKYIAKVTDDDDDDPGGAGGGAPLDIVTYCHSGAGTDGAPEVVGTCREDTVGRVWGYVRRELLPLGKVWRDRFELGGWVAGIKRAANGLLRSTWRARPVKRRRGRPFQVRGGMYRGFTLFSEDVTTWLAMIGDGYQVAAGRGLVVDGRRVFFA